MEKSDRKLRSNTRKDYKKMVNVTYDSEDDHLLEPGFSGEFVQNKKNNNNDGGEIIGNEFILSEGESTEADNDIVESSDEEIKVAREELEQLRQKQKELTKRSKLEKIAEEKKALRKSLDKLGARKKKSSHVTVKSLRKMDDVVEQVDKLMDRNLKIKHVEDSSDSDAEIVPVGERTRFHQSDDEKRYRNKVEEGNDYNLFFISHLSIQLFLA